MGTSEGMHGGVRRWDPSRDARRQKRWSTHQAHEAIPPPVRVSWGQSGQHGDGKPGGTPAVSASASRSNPLVTLDGSHGEGGGQILRTALSLSLLTGKPFRMIKIRANREKPGLRPQHLKAVEAAAALGRPRSRAARSGSRELVFRPGAYTPHDLTIDIGTAGSTSLVLQTLHLPLAMRAESAVRVVLTGGTFNPKAPPFPFLEQTWRGYLAAFGMPVAVAMPAAGFYPRGGGQLDAWIEPATPAGLGPHRARPAPADPRRRRRRQPPRRHRRAAARPGDRSGWRRKAWTPTSRSRSHAGRARGRGPH